jgi:hypothetical protein
MTPLCRVCIFSPRIHQSFLDFLRFFFLVLPPSSPVSLYVKVPVGRSAGLCPVSGALPPLAAASPSLGSFPWVADEGAPATRATRRKTRASNTNRAGDDQPPTYHEHRFSLWPLKRTAHFVWTLAATAAE